MHLKRILALALIACLLGALSAPAAAAAEAPALGNFLERCGPLLEDGLGALTDWLDGQTSKLPPALRDTLRDVDTETLFSDLADLVGETAELDDAALRTAVLELAEKHGIHLVEDQVQQLMKLCRTLEKLDAAQLRERTDTLRQELSTPSGLRGAWSAVVRAVTDAVDWLKQAVSGLF